MTIAPGEEEVFVEAPARLHFGMLDLRGGLGRRFGGIGAAAPAPTLLVSARRAASLEVVGEDAERASAFARRFLSFHGLASAGARITVHRALPSHAGLGSGTQLGLAVARALAEIFSVATDPPALARATGRARRSGIGTWTFAAGGLVVEGGRRPGSDEVAPLITRLQFPGTWRCVVAVPGGPPGVSGAAEAAAFAELPLPSEQDVQRVAHLVLMALPSLAEADLGTFGASLTAIQAITGRWFAPVQGGTFAAGPGEQLVTRMTQLGALGVGQSSWGPAIYGIVDGEAAGLALARRLEAELEGCGMVYEGPFRSHGARVWCGQAPRQERAV